MAGTDHCAYTKCMHDMHIAYCKNVSNMAVSIQTAKERNCMRMCLHRVYVQEMHDVLCVASIQQWLYSDAVKDWWPATPSHIITYLPIGCKIISQLVCKWALQSMTFQKQECKCLVPNQSLCKLMKEQFGFVCRSFVLLWFVCQSNSMYRCRTERRENSKLHATRATCQFGSWKSYQAIILQL